jgi:NAD(P)-dependent dehydrogenase (short-subunit alcohol dehydrogenase family)
VVLLGRKVPKLSRTYDACKALGPQPAIYPLDLAGADPADYETLADRVVADLGGLHGILHCAAEFTGLRPLETTPPEDFVRNLHVNLSAPWLLSQACLPALRAQADSAIVFVLDDPARVQRAYWGPLRRRQGRAARA